MTAAMSAMQRDLAAFAVSGEAGSVIYRAGDGGSELYVVQRGQIELCDKDGNRLAVHELGDFFGEHALFNRTPRDHTARALTAYSLIRLDWSTLEAVVKHRPDVALNMMRVMCRRAADVRGGHAISTVRPMAAAALVHAGSGTRYPIPRAVDVIVGRRDKATSRMLT
jgi:CRP-like cAMP-binding protein